jgi:hypothetical protein
VLEQRRLPDPRLAANHQRPALAPADVIDQAVQLSALLSPTEKAHGGLNSRRFRIGRDPRKTTASQHRLGVARNSCRVPERSHGALPAVSSCRLILVEKPAQERSTPDPAINRLGNRRCRARRGGGAGIFNGIFWKHLLERGEPAGTPGRIALPVAGANGPAKDLALDLVDQLGFDPVDAGPIDESWRQQPGTPVYGKNYDAEKTRIALAEASPERLAEFRAS